MTFSRFASRVRLGLGCGILIAVMCGCGANYSWRSGVPEDMRTVAVPTFRNESNVSELGAIAARQLLREFQREGTFRIRPTDEAALVIQGVITKATSVIGAYNRRSGLRISGYDFTADVEVSVIDRRSRKVLVDNRKYVAQATLTAGQDLTTARRDASGRLMDDLARQVVDDVLNLTGRKDGRQ